MGMPLLWVSIAFLFGLAAGKLLNFHWIVWLILACQILVLVFLDPVLCKYSRRWKTIRGLMPLTLGIILLFMALGGIRVTAVKDPIWSSNDLAWYNDKGEYLLTGWISSTPDQRSDQTVYQIKFIEIEDPQNPDWSHSVHRINGLAQVYMQPNAGWKYGDLLQFIAKPQEPSADRDFSYREYLAAFNIHTVIYHPTHVVKAGINYGSPFRKGLIRLREKARETIFTVYPQPESGLLAGILLGMDNDLPPSLTQAYRDTGVSHIIAISGFNMAVLASMFLMIFKRMFNPYWAALIASILLVIYTFFVDGSPSVVRALIMAVVGAGGHLIGRRQVGINALFFTAAVMCLFNPLLLGNISFQLSFAATFGLVVFAQPMQDWLRSVLEKHFSEKTASHLTNPLSEYFLFTLAAQFATLPVIAWHFGRISFSSLLTNPLVLPVQPAVLILGGVTTVAGSILPLLGKVLMIFSWPLLKYTNFMVTLLAKIKGGVLTIHPSFSIWIPIVIMMIILIFLFRQKIKKKVQSGWWIWAVGLMIGACFAVWSILAHQPDGLLHLHLVRCQDKTTLFLQTPGGEVLVIDPRGELNELTATLEKSLSPWEFHVDAVLLTNSRNNAALAELSERIQVEKVLLAPASYRQEEGWQTVTIPDGIEVMKIFPGQKIEIESGVSITLVGEEVQAAALLVEYGSTRILIPNGVDFANIKSSSPDTMDKLTALLLTPADVSYIPLRVWTQLNPGAILWNDASLSPFMDSFDLENRSEVVLESDGNNTWLKQ